MPRPKTCARESCRCSKGESLLQPVATDPVRERYAYRETSAPKELFTEREIGILRLLAGGYSNKEIARSLYPGRGHGQELCVGHPRQARYARSHARGAEGHHAAHHLRVPGRETGISPAADGLIPVSRPGTDYFSLALATI